SDAYRTRQAGSRRPRPGPPSAPRYRWPRRSRASTWAWPPACCCSRPAASAGPGRGPDSLGVMGRTDDEGSGLLFPDAAGARTATAGSRSPAGARSDPRRPRADSPLADRLRPRTLEEIVGQEDVLGPGKPLRRTIEQDALRSLILWGPPGSGKTTLAHVIRGMTSAHFEAMSAVLSGVKELREILKEAEARRTREGRRTIVFIDEIHRYNKAQQDALLAHVESGDIVLIGATTENPSFEVNSALLSRSRVVVLKPLAPEQLLIVLNRALADAEPGLGGMGAEVAEDALAYLARASDGDARTALNVLEMAVTTANADP